jgi:hypothetical protein
LKNAKSVNIAVTNFQVEEKYWKASVIQEPDKSIERYKQLAEIVSDAVRKRPDYLVLPELSIPQEWAWLASKKLLANNISLVTGVEYIHSEDDKKKVVHNSIMMFLIADDIGFKHMRFFRQDKETAAHGEANELRKIGGIKLEPHSGYKDKKIFQHGNFFFSCLICSELTDISNRMKLRGEIDTLIVVEWNRDIKSFNALVESASLDIHSYVVQVNNRLYGDSRVRAPGKEDYERDIVQVRGGEHDYLVVGKIDIESLRDFQSHNISPDKLYKPVPTGFEMSSKRAKWKNNGKTDS